MLTNDVCASCKGAGLMSKFDPIEDLNLVAAEVSLFGF